MVRSPLFYVGDKYKLMPQLKELIPEDIDIFYDAFTGGGSVSMGVSAKEYKMNDIDSNIIHLHRYLMAQLKDSAKFINKMYKLIDYYGLTCSAKGNVPNDFIKIKKTYKKTYYARINKLGYLKLRDDYNSNQSNLDLLYLLLVFGFNHMTRFNKKGKFNLPVGNVDWNRNVEQALTNYANFSNENKITLYHQDFEKFILNQNICPKDFIYFDPPYLMTSSEYNKIWNSDTEKRLYHLLNTLNEKGYRWGLSNILIYRGEENSILWEWIRMNNYYVYPIESNYISRFDNTLKEDTKEVFIMNKPSGRKNNG